MNSVSVIIPSFNRAHTLPRAIASVQRQTLAAAEIIVVDDGSDDQTRSCIAQGFPGVTYLHQDNRGVSAARNLGIRHARGAWLAFLDSDDEWLPEKLEAQIADLERNPYHRWIHCNEIWIRNGMRVNPMDKHRKDGGWIFPRCLPRCVVSPSAVMIHRSVFADFGLFDEQLPACEDYDLWLRLSAHLPVLYLERALIVKHGGHDDQLSRRYWGMDRFRIASLERLLVAGDLSPDQRAMAIEALNAKISVYLAGAAKRGKRSEQRLYEAKLARYHHDGARATTLKGASDA